MLNKRELKIFFTFFIIYSFFVYWIGWNEQSHLALTRAIADEGRFEIDSYANQTSDRAFYNGHYYSDKDPGPSFLAVPIYGTWEFIYSNFFSNGFKEKYSGNNNYITTVIGENNIPIYEYINPSFFILTSMILVTIFTSSLFSALTIVLIYKISRYFTENERHRIILIIAAGLGTLMFTYSLVFMKHASETFFSFLTFYILFKVKQEKIKENKYFAIAGISLGVALTCSVTAVIVGIACLIYLIYYQKKKKKHFIFGGLIGLLPFLFYNFLIFNTPFTLSRHYLDQTIWPKLGGIDGLQIPNPFVALRLTFYPEKGIFYYSPILFISLFGLFYMYKKFKLESKLIIFIFISFLIMNSSWWAWWGGANFGSRHLTPIMPFLIIPLIFVLKNADKVIKISMIALLCLSIFNNFLGLQVVRDEFSGGKNIISLDPQYEGNINNFAKIKNPIYDYYLPLFLKNGPRSRLLENIVKNEAVIDIRNVPLSKNPSSFSDILVDKITLFSFPGIGILNLKISFLSLYILLIFIFLIWWKEILKSMKKLKFKIIFFILFLLIFILFFIKVTDISLYKNWYDNETFNNVTFRHMSQNATILIYNFENTPKNVKFYLNISSSIKSRTLQFFLNNELVDSFSIPNQITEVVTSLLTILPGENILLFNSKEGCDMPSKITLSNDTRCISFTLFNSKQVEWNSIDRKFDYYKNWYQLEKINNVTFRHMSQNATILIYNFGNIMRNVNLTLNITSDEDLNRTLNIFINNRFVNSYEITPKGNFISILINTTPGENILLFNSKEGCSITPYYNEERCVSFSIFDMKIQNT